MRFEAQLNMITVTLKQHPWRALGLGTAFWGSCHSPLTQLQGLAIDGPGLPVAAPGPLHGEWPGSPTSQPSPQAHILGASTQALAPFHTSLLVWHHSSSMRRGKPMYLLLHEASQTRPLCLATVTESGQLSKPPAHQQLLRVYN